MQLVVSNNRVLAYGEDFLSMGGTVICNSTGKAYQNATIAECDCVPADIDTVGYEYHAGEFKPCAPYGKTDNGYIMVSCDECGTPKQTGVRVEGNAVSIEGGGTGANNRKDAFYNLNNLGRNAVTADTDTPRFWANLGNGYMEIAGDGLLENQPATYGVVLNYCVDYFNVHQIFMPLSGQVLSRGGNINNNAWNNGKWYSADEFLPLSGGTLTGDVTFNREAEQSIYFKNSAHNCKVYSGPPSSETGIGFWDSANGRQVLVYEDTNNHLILGGEGTGLVLKSGMYGEEGTEPTNPVKGQFYVTLI